MTAGISKTELNNFEEMLSTVQKNVDKLDAGMDKSISDFKKVFEKSVDNLNKKENVDNKQVSQIVRDFSDKETLTKKEVLTKREILTNEEVNAVNEAKLTLDDEQLVNLKVLEYIKNSLSQKLSNDEEITWAEFGEKLVEIMEEVNAETSLDLTLSKDIEAIISQLQEAVEDITESLENVVDLGLISNIETVTLANANVDYAQIEAQTSEETMTVPVKQLFSIIDEAASKTGLLSERIMDTEASIELDSNIFEQTEIIEFAETLSEEVVLTKSEENTTNIDIENILEEDILKDLNIESLQAEVDTAGGETLMQRQAPEEIAVKTLINKDIEVFDLKIDATQNTQTVQQPQAKSVEINPSRILEQITKQLDGLQNGSKVNIVLNPESLGKVNIQLLSTKEGLMAQLTVTTQEAKDVLMKGLDGLKESLLAHGVNSDNVSIKVADSQKTEYNEDWTEQEGSRGGNKGQKEQEKEEKQKGLFEQMMAQTLEKDNGKV